MFSKETMFVKFLPRVTNNVLFLPYVWHTEDILKRNEYAILLCVFFYMTRFFLTLHHLLSLCL
jgi:hypothetical protein